MNTNIKTKLAVGTAIAVFGIVVLIGCKAVDEAQNADDYYDRQTASTYSQGPDNPSIVINGGDASTDTRNVTLRIAATDNVGVTAYYTSKSSAEPETRDSGWTAVPAAASYAADVAFTLAEGPAGTRTVYLWFKDIENNLSTTASDAIWLKADLTIGSISGNTAEDGITATFTVKLSTQPDGDVVINAASSDTGEGTVFPSSLTFTSSNWNVDQTVTVTGVDDGIDDEDQTYTIQLTVDTGSTTDTTGYASLNPGVVNVSNVESPLYSGMVPITGGTFQMGDINGGGDSDELPVHSVTVGDFYISDHEVTAAEYKECVDDGGCSYNGGTGSYYTYGASGKENHPMNYVSWTETQAYIAWLNGKSSRVYRLCTEAEWEYAARAGTSTKYTCGDSDSCLNDVAWYLGNNSPAGTKADKTKQANAWGLYDMYGNVLEWVQDWYHSNYTSAPTDGSAWESPTGSYRVFRGGAFYGSTYDLRSADRIYNSPGYRNNFIGFRLCSVAAGFAIGSISGNTAEDGTTATFTVKLSTQPDGDVVIDAASSDTGEGTVSPSSLTFTSSNWNTTQTVTVTGVDDGIEDGDQNYTIELTVDTGSTTDTTGYASLNPGVVNATNVEASGPYSGMVPITGGTFQMGDINGGGYSDELPVHSVTVGSFSISDHEVTAAEYKECVDDGGCSYNGGTGSYYTYGASGKENHPLNYVSWTETQAYIAWLNGKSSRVYRLCTEAEWEYAARAGTTTKWSCGNDDSCLNDVAWWSGNNSPAGTKTVKTKQANAWGLYDMHGNVYEWVQDWYHSSYSGAPNDGSAWESPTGSYRVIRGGLFSYSASGLRSAYRNGYSPGNRHYSIGFRLCSVP